MCKGFFISVFLASFLWVGAQDSIQTPEKESAKLLFSFDARRSFVLDENVKINGLRIGAKMPGNYNIGIGFYGMNEPIRRYIPLDKSQYPDSKDTVFFDFDYTTLFYERIWYHSKRWELSTPIHFGIGTLQLDYLSRDIEQPRKQFVKGAALMTEISFTAQYKIIRWFAVGSGVGYRKMLLKEKNVTRALDAPIYIFQFKILLGELYKQVFKKGDNPDGW